MNANGENFSEKVWGYMRDFYGEAWIRGHGERDERGTWSAALTKFDPCRIKAAIAECPRQFPDRPPTLGQFQALVKMAEDPEKADLPALPKPETSADVPREPPEELGKLLEVLTSMSDRHRQVGRMTEQEDMFHRKVLGLDAESVRKRSRPYVADGHPHKCARRGCNSPGTMSSSTTGGGPWLCREHFAR